MPLELRRLPRQKLPEVQKTNWLEVIVWILIYGGVFYFFYRVVHL